MDDSTPIIDVTAHPSGFVPTNTLRAFLRRRRGAIAIYFVVLLAGALWWVLSATTLYKAESRVMIVRLGSGGPISEAELASEIELVRDPTHLEQTATKQFVSPTDAQVNQLARKIDASLTVQPAGKSNLLAISYRDPDPLTAARIANRVVELYMAERRFIFQLNGPASSRPAGIDPAAGASELLSAFDVVNHGSGLHTELQSRVQHRIDLESRLSDLKAQIRDHQESAKVLRKRLTSLPDQIRARTRTRTSANPSDRFAEDTEVVNPLKQQIESELIKNDTAVAGLQARLEETNNGLREARLAEDLSSALASERDKLERRAIDARGVPDPASTTATERPNLRATLINRAETPYAPEPRHLWLWIPLAILAALALAILIAFLIDQFDRPIYTPRDFEDASGVPPIDNQFAQGAGA